MLGRGSLLLLLAIVPATIVEAQTSAEVIEARPGAADILDLEQCVAEALANNDALVAEREKRAELKGQKYQAVSIGLPTIDLSGDWSKSRDPSFALDPTFAGGDDAGSPFAFLDPIFEDYNATHPGDPLAVPEFSFMPSPEDIPSSTYWHAQANLNWTINPIKVIGAVGAANHGITRQELLITDLEHQTVEQTVSIYHEIIRQNEVLSAVEASVANQREFLDITRLRYEMGMATRLDTLQAAVAVANIEPRLRSSRQAVRNAGARLNALMGRHPGEPLSIGGGQFVETATIDLSRALELARLRPDVRSVETYEQLLRRNRAAQKADMRPYLTIGGAWGYVGADFDDLKDTKYDFWRASVTVNVPLFDGLLTKGLVQQTEAQIRRTGHEISGLRRQVEVEVLEIMTNLDAARENLRAAELNLTSAEEVLEEMTLNYRVGKRDYLSVLEAQSVWADARSNLTEARYEVVTLTASLKRAIGFSPLLPLAAIDGLCPGGSR